MSNGKSMIFGSAIFVGGVFGFLGSQYLPPIKQVDFDSLPYSDSMPVAEKAMSLCKLYGASQVHFYDYNNDDITDFVVDDVEHSRALLLEYKYKTNTFEESVLPGRFIDRQPDSLLYDEYGDNRVYSISSPTADR